MVSHCVISDRNALSVERRSVRRAIRAERARQGRAIVVLDDDPTGSQCVSDVELVTVPDADDLTRALRAPAATCFALTNTRGMNEAEAGALTRTWSGLAFQVARRDERPVDVVSRGDSTLRGHVIVEQAAIDAQRRQVLGSSYDGIIVAPAYFEAGRFTRDRIHFAVSDGVVRPVGETPYAADETFGYSSSDLAAFLEERSEGAIGAADVAWLDLAFIRRGPDAVENAVNQLHEGRVMVVDGATYADYEIIALGVTRAQASGRALLFRAGPSFVRALAGLEPTQAFADRMASTTDRGGVGGLVVVGSHVPLTTAQVERAVRDHDLAVVDVDVAGLLDGSTSAGYLQRLGERVRGLLPTTNVALCTSRELMVGTDRLDSLRVSRTVSRAVAEIVHQVLAARPRWVIAKGGITSHDIAVHGLGLRRATVLGQLFTGAVSVLRCLDSYPEALEMPYVVFPGNVGDEGALSAAVGIMSSWHDTASWAAPPRPVPEREEDR